MELLKEVAEIAKAQNNEISADEIKKYFTDMELEEDQFEHIYSYLAECNIHVPGFAKPAVRAMVPADNEKSVEQLEEEPINEEDSAYLTMYLEDLKHIIPLSESEEMELFQKMIDGEEGAKQRLMEGLLSLVVDIAHNYKNRGVNMEDLIQEGNLGLMHGLNSLNSSVEKKDYRGYIMENTKQYIENVIDEQMDSSDWENAVLAKTNLIHEASRYLAEENGQVASIRELSEYTRISEEEIKDILNLSLDAVKVKEL
jgi:DNA-directed RNA polymerase, sigma subunit (sigma70/sigma32)